MRLGLDDKIVTQQEIDFFMKGDVSVGQKTDAPPLKWLSEANWKDVSYLEDNQPAYFSGLRQNLVDHEQEWHQVISHPSIVF